MSMIRQMEAGKLKVKIYDSRYAMGLEAANEAAEAIVELLGQKVELNIIFAAAPSQNEFLAGLAENLRIDWQRINAYHMDEYIGLAPDAPQGFGNFLKKKIFGRVLFKSVNYLNGNAADIEAECERYSDLLRENPPDLVFMGIGENGHIAFNDPHVAKFDDSKLVKVVTLDNKCRTQQVNDGCFKAFDLVPENAITLTIPALMSGRKIFCVVPAETKANAVYNTVKGDISEACPASILKAHDDAVLYTDPDSARML